MKEVRNDWFVVRYDEAEEKDTIRYSVFPILYEFENIEDEESSVAKKIMFGCKIEERVIAIAHVDDSVENILLGIVNRKGLATLNNYIHIYYWDNYVILSDMCRDDGYHMILEAISKRNAYMTFFNTNKSQWMTENLIYGGSCIIDGRLIE